jgi:hypothetical protein
MLKLLPLLAADLYDITTPDPLGQTKPSNLASRHWQDILLLVGAAVALALVLFLWAYLTRKSRQREMALARGARVIYRREKGDGPPRPGHKVKYRKRRRREHAENWPRNPTLAEAGGLPPPRPDEPEAPPPQAQTQ